MKPAVSSLHQLICSPLNPSARRTRRETHTVRLASRVLPVKKREGREECERREEGVAPSAPGCFEAHGWQVAGSRLASSSTKLKPGNDDYEDGDDD